MTKSQLHQFGELFERLEKAKQALDISNVHAIAPALSLPLAEAFNRVTVLQTMAEKAFAEYGRDVGVAYEL